MYLIFLTLSDTALVLTPPIKDYHCLIQSIFLAFPAHELIASRRSPTTLDVRKAIQFQEVAEVDFTDAVFQDTYR